MKKHTLSVAGATLVALLAIGSGAALGQSPSPDP